MAESEALTLQLREALIAAGLAANSVRLYTATIQRAEQWFASQGSSLAGASASMLSEYIATQPGSWSNRNLMRAAFGHYWRLVERTNPPIRALRVPPKPEGECKALEEDDARLVAKYAEAIARAGDRRGLAVLFGLFTALRRAEIAALHWSAITGHQIRVVGKGSKDATLPVHSRLQAVLDDWPRDKAGYIFVGNGGRLHVSKATVWEWALNVAEEAGVVERVPTHRLRHTALATANDRTGDLRATSALARHTKVQTTMIYTRTKAARLRAIVEAIDY